MPTDYGIMALSELVEEAARREWYTDETGYWHSADGDQRTCYSMAFSPYTNGSFVTERYGHNNASTLLAAALRLDDTAADEATDPDCIPDRCEAMTDADLKALDELYAEAHRRGWRKTDAFWFSPEGWPRVGHQTVFVGSGRSCAWVRCAGDERARLAAALRLDDAKNPADASPGGVR